MRNEVIWVRRYNETGSRLNGAYERPAFTVSKVITQNRYGKSQVPVYTVARSFHTFDEHPTQGQTDDQIFFTFQAAKAYGMELVRRASGLGLI